MENIVLVATNDTVLAGLCESSSLGQLCNTRAFFLQNFAEIKGDINNDLFIQEFKV